jgi:hypothetical protein
MIVYLLIHSIDYEGSGVIAVYSAKEPAIEQARLLAESAEKIWKNSRYHDDYVLKVNENKDYFSVGDHNWYVEEYEVIKENK